MSTTLYNYGGDARSPDLAPTAYASAILIARHRSMQRGGTKAHRRGEALLFASLAPNEFVGAAEDCLASPLRPISNDQNTSLSPQKSGANMENLFLGENSRDEDSRTRTLQCARNADKLRYCFHQRTTMWCPQKSSPPWISPVTIRALSRALCSWRLPT